VASWSVKCDKGRAHCVASTPLIASQVNREREESPGSVVAEATKPFRGNQRKRAPEGAARQEEIKGGCVKPGIRPRALPSGLTTGLDAVDPRSSRAIAWSELVC